MVENLKKEKGEADKASFKKDMEKAITEGLKKHGKELSKEEKKLALEALKKTLIERKAPGRAMGMDDNILELMYTQAYNLYQSGNFKEANDFFKMLSFLDRGRGRNWRGLAASYHKMEQYGEAVASYFAWAAVDEETPLPYYHAYDCFERLENQVGAFLALNGAISRCGDKPEYAKIKEKCKIMHAKLGKELDLADDEETTEAQKPEL